MAVQILPPTYSLKFQLKIYINAYPKSKFNVSKMHYINQGYIKKKITDNTKVNVSVQCSLIKIIYAALTKSHNFPFSIYKVEGGGEERAQKRLRLQYV